MSDYEKVIENIPTLFIRRQGDWHAEGANNTLIVLGTDRVKPDGAAEGNDGLGTGPGAGTIAAIAGRHNANGHPDINNDDATLYLSMKTDADVNVHSDKLVSGKNGIAKNKSGPGPAAILKSKDVRVACNTDGSVKVFVSGKNDRYIMLNNDNCEVHVGKNFINMTGDTITTNADATEVIIKNQQIKLGKLAQALAELIDIIALTPFISQTGNLGAPVPLNPELATKLQRWKNDWINISDLNFLKMDG